MTNQTHPLHTDLIPSALATVNQHASVRQDARRTVIQTRRDAGIFPGWGVKF